MRGAASFHGPLAAAIPFPGGEALVLDMAAVPLEGSTRYSGSTCTLYNPL